MRLRFTGAVAAALVLGTGCAATTYDETVTTGTEVATTTTTPTGDAATLLPQLAALTGTLSEVIASKGDDGAVAEQITALWAAVVDEVSITRPDLLPDMQANVDRCSIAAQFNRPADADKAFRNLSALVDAYLA